MSFDLKYFREEILKETQQSLAMKMGIRQDAISRMERAPEKMTLEELMLVAEVTGYSLADLTDFEEKKIEPVNVLNNWKEAFKVKENLTSAINQFSARENIQFIDGHLIGLSDNIKKMIRKPRIAFLGNSDVGKSTMINSLLGQEVLPAAWTPTTSLPILIKHIDEKPDFLKDSTLILKENILSSKMDEFKVYDKDYLASFILESGDANLISEFGTRQGNKYNQNIAKSVIIYVNTPILKTCELLDLPGFGTGDRDEDDFIASAGRQTADIFVYLSLVNAFMRGTDIDYLKETIKLLSPIERKNKNTYKPLNNLYIVSSQAHILHDKGTSINKALDEVTTILNDGCKRINQTLPDEYWQERAEITGYDYTEDKFSMRFFPYSKDHSELREAFETDLKQLLETVPAVVQKNGEAAILEFRELVTENLSSDIRQLTDENLTKVEKQESLTKLKEEYPQIVQTIEAEKTKALTVFQSSAEASRERLRNSISVQLDIDQIISKIDSRNFKNRKSDREALVSLVNTTIEQAYNWLIRAEDKKIKKTVETFMTKLETDILVNGISTRNTGNFSIKFDAKQAFVSGVTGALAYGGLSLYMASLGNLGGYILITKAVGALSALGIGVGGTAAAVSAISMVGGPVTLAIGLAVATSLVAYSITGIGWKKSLAKRIIKLFEKENITGKYEQALNTYWIETYQAFTLGAERVISDLKDKIKKEEEWLMLNDKEHEQLIKQITYEKHFVEGLYSICELKTNN